MASKHDKVFTYSGLFGVGVIYLVLLIALIVSFVFTKFDTALFIGLIIALTVICGLIALIIYLCSRRVKKTNNNTKEKLEKGELKTPKRGDF